MIMGGAGNDRGGHHGLGATAPAGVRDSSAGGVRGQAQAVRGGPQRLRGPGPQGGRRAGGRAGRPDPQGAWAAGRSCTACRAAPPVMLGGFDSRPGPPHGHHLQPHGRAARLQGERALGERALRVHEEGRHLLRPGHHRRQGPGPDRALRGAGRPRRRRPRQRPLPLGDRGGDRLAALRGHPEEDRARRRHRRRGGLRHRVDLPAAAGPLRRAARPPALHLPPGDRGHRPALGHRRGRRPQPDRRAVPARLGDHGRPHRAGEDPRLLRRRGARQPRRSSRTSRPPGSA